MMQWVGGIALTLMTLWVLVQGFRIVTGRSRDSMMVLVTNMARAALIVSAATTMGAFGTNLQSFLTHDVKAEITKVVTGSNESPEAQIDKSLAWMQVALSSIDAIQIMNDGELLEDKKRALFFIGMGTAGPAITAGAMLMLYEIAMALFIGFGPCSSSACCSTRPSSCSNVGCSTALARCSPWPYLQRWFPSHWTWWYVWRPLSGPQRWCRNSSSRKACPTA